MIAGTHNDWKSPIFDEGDFQVEVLPQTLFTEFVDLIHKKQLIEARGLLVTIRRGQYFKAKNIDAIRFDEKLREHITILEYSKLTGLDTEKLDDSNLI